MTLTVFEFDIIQDVKVTVKDYMQHFAVSERTAKQYRKIDYECLEKTILRPENLEIRLSNFYLLYGTIPDNLRGYIRLKSANKCN
jgi:hypothetical protein